MKLTTNILRHLISEEVQFLHERSNNYENVENSVRRNLPTGGLNMNNLDLFIEKVEMDTGILNFDDLMVSIHDSLRNVGDEASALVISRNYDLY